MASFSFGVAAALYAEHFVKGVPVRRRRHIIQRKVYRMIRIRHQVDDVNEYFVGIRVEHDEYADQRTHQKKEHTIERDQRVGQVFGLACARVIRWVVFFHAAIVYERFGSAYVRILVDHWWIGDKCRTRRIVQAQIMKLKNKKTIQLVCTKIAFICINFL